MANHLLTSLQLSPLYEVTQPFEWMNLISMPGKTNFFEKRNGDYQLAGGHAVGIGQGVFASRGVLIEYQGNEKKEFFFSYDSWKTIEPASLSKTFGRRNSSMSYRRTLAAPLMLKALSRDDNFRRPGFTR